MSTQVSKPSFLGFPRRRAAARLRRERLGEIALEQALDGIDIASAAHTALPAPVRSLSLGFAARYLLQMSITSLPLLLADVAVLFLCSGIVVALNAAGLTESAVVGQISLAWSLFLMQPLIGFAIGVYPGVGLAPSAELRLTSLATSLWIAVLATVFIARAGFDVVEASVLTLIWAVAMILIPFARALARSIASKFKGWGLPTIVLGGGREAAAIYRTLLANPSRGLRPVGIIDDPHAHWHDSHVDPSWYLGAPAATAAIVDELGAFWGIVPLNSASSTEAADIMDRHAAVFPHLLVLRDASTVRRAWDGAFDCGGMVGLQIDERLLLPQSQILKRSMDLTLALVGGALLAPVLGLIALGVKFTSPGPVLYGQERIGRRGRRFTIWKFRSMSADAGQLLQAHLDSNPQLHSEWERTQKLADDPRVTGFGRWLRQLSLDELPQLWNVIVGDMSLVGPRPIVEAEIAKYRDSFQLYTRVRPGITGLWQVSGRNLTTYEQRVHLDATYARNWSPWLDLYTLARTLRAVIFREGAF